MVEQTKDQSWCLRTCTQLLAPWPTDLIQGDYLLQTPASLAVKGSDNRHLPHRIDRSIK